MVTIRVFGFQNYVNYERMNPIEITVDSNNAIEKLSNYKKLKYRFLIGNL